MPRLPRPTTAPAAVESAACYRVNVSPSFDKRVRRDTRMFDRSASRHIAPRTYSERIIKPSTTTTFDPFQDRELVVRDLLVEPRCYFHCLDAAVSLDKEGNGLHAIGTVLNVFGFHIYMTGEHNSILRSTTMPLSHGLRVVVDSAGSPAHYGQSIRIVTRFSDSSTHVVSDGGSLSAAVTDILHILDLLKASEHQDQLIRRPTTLQLLDILDAEKFTPSPHFRGVGRAVADDRLLDACVELLTPFGFQPVLQDACVCIRVWGLRNTVGHSFWDVTIGRFDYLLSAEQKANLDPQLAKSVYIEGLWTLNPEMQVYIQNRHISNVAASAGVWDVYQQYNCQENAWVYSLVHGDRSFLVRRLLDFRNECRETMNQARDANFSRFLGRQFSRYVPGQESLRGPKRVAKTPLRQVVNVEDVEPETAGAPGDEGMQDSMGEEVSAGILFLNNNYAVDEAMSDVQSSMPPTVAMPGDTLLSTEPLLHEAMEGLQEGVICGGSAVEQIEADQSADDMESISIAYST